MLCLPSPSANHGCLIGMWLLVSSFYLGGPWQQSPRDKPTNKVEGQVQRLPHHFQHQLSQQLLPCTTSIQEQQCQNDTHVDNETIMQPNNGNDNSNKRNISNLNSTKPRHHSKNNGKPTSTTITKQLAAAAAAAAAAAEAAAAATGQLIKQNAITTTKHQNNNNNTNNNNMTTTKSKVIFIRSCVVF